MKNSGIMFLKFMAITVSLFLYSCNQGEVEVKDTSKPTLTKPKATEQLATFAGGCFWCMEPPFEGRDGVKSVVSGYTGGKEDNPTYKQVSSGETTHTEAVQIVFDPSVISYEKLLEIFWQSFDPTDKTGQFADRGLQYRPGIFTHDEEQKKEAALSKKALSDSKRFKKEIVVDIVNFEKFYPAETYHQDYYIKNTDHYKRYRKGSGREAFLKSVWGSDIADHAKK
jgi:peptide methionine sulfoxide reductase msrA/msrB